MKTSSTKLIAALAVGVLGLAASSAYACGGGGGGNRGGGLGGYPGGLGGGYNRGGSYNNQQGQNCENGGNYTSNNYANNNSSNVNYGGGRAYEPFHSSYIVQPGDGFYTISLKEYGTSSNMNHIARFNRMSPDAALVLGQRLLLPSISASGKLTQSRAPAAEGDAAAQDASTSGGSAPVTQNFSAPRTVPATTVSKPVVEETLPKIAVGSTLQVDGTVLGEDRGVVRLRIGGVAFPVEVIEWTANAAKIRLPELEVTEPTKAEVEILRADGSVASKSGVELTPAGDRLALGN